MVLQTMHSMTVFLLHNYHFPTVMIATVTIKSSVQLFTESHTCHATKGPDDALTLSTD